MGVVSCSSPDQRSIPADTFYFPSVLLQDQDHLFVVNSNLDLQYSSGNILQIDLNTQRVVGLQSTPSLAGEACLLASNQILITDQTHPQLVQSAQPLLPLTYQAAYFLKLSPDRNWGLVGYLTPVVSESWNDSKDSLLSNQPEIQSFALSASGIELKDSFQLKNCFPSPSRSLRRIGRLGALIVQDSQVFVLFEFVVDDPDHVNRSYKHAFFLQAPLSDVQAGHLCSSSNRPFDLSQTEQSQGLRDLAITKDQSTAYVLMDEEPLLLRVSLQPSPMVTARVATCRGPTRLKLSPNEESVFVSCAKSNELVAYNAKDLLLYGKENRSDAPGGPVDILFDQTTDHRIFVTYQQDHKIGIFSYANVSSRQRSLAFSEWLQLSR
ncbi:MAG: hypothetical protein I8H75_00175 [Myxococcaceae bacterium]|nr:hypothetical protein [Myxococcaceae bacterium]MBH2005761.1 hypothetical protein [Myxococcaceae bacterium]